MKNQLTLLTGTKETQATLHEQLEDILGEFIHIESYAVDEHVPNQVSDDLIIFSSYLIEKEAAPFIAPDSPHKTAIRTINYQHIERLLELEEGTSVLCVNDTFEMAEETIDTLKKMGIDHLSFTAYYPGLKNTYDISTAITPGEVTLAPPSVEKIIDIGVRLIDITTLIEILDHFHLKEKLGGVISNRYTGKIIDLSKKLSEMNKQTELLNQHLQQVVDGVNDGVMAIDSDQKVTVFNPFIEEYSGLSHTHAMGKPVHQLFKDPKLLKFMTTPQEEGLYFTLNGYNLMIYRVQWEESDNVIFIFKNSDETITMEKAARKQLLKTGYIAKYTFKDIIGKSPTIEKAKAIGHKLAKTPLPVLIHGESGTGKELFAHAIHHESDRLYEPFLAVNFSALPEDLLESELFGYEEGAFTGAKKGGKKGLFEQADGGTIFLDEIGDISLKLQARLLRVIQEMEIRKIGGSKTIPINVRIIAATNKDLLQLIEQGKFREDLYHRLKVLYVSVPPLRERKTDIPALVEQFLLENHTPNKALGTGLLGELMRYDWYGNIRELKNTISYLLTVSEGDTITINDLPDEDFFQRPKKNIQRETTSLVDDRLNKKVLEMVLSLNESMINASRKKIYEELAQDGSIYLSEQQIRRVLADLKERGFVTIKRGRAGTQITEAGANYIHPS
ncbi:sigma 54-interacting transcriptional regulator [Halobacillus sp. GSS1]|uniref:sigma-54 interaction domain-containing protein n=1 Tax=Halobacillus sp. GSS1 TaxID=2815919 RepID=UPI001A8D9E93|nr:sigma 54-interacting transcriptional regulator [Halobacillus sp. GSS1]MBN9655758.1 sigma 54-interacting transcriptional regulator [Halobacillus sp. GSS1]